MPDITINGTKEIAHTVLLSKTIVLEVGGKKILRQKNLMKNSAQKNLVVVRGQDIKNF